MLAENRTCMLWNSDTALNHFQTVISKRIYCNYVYQRPRTTVMNSLNFCWPLNLSAALARLVQPSQCFYWLVSISPYSRLFVARDATSLPVAFPEEDASLRLFGFAKVSDVSPFFIFVVVGYPNEYLLYSWREAYFGEVAYLGPERSSSTSG